MTRDTIERSFELANLPEGWGALALIVIVAAMLFLIVTLYRRECRTGSSPRMRWVLAGLRCGVIATLVLVWLEPVLSTYIHRRIEAVTLVLVDRSASMGLTDRYPHAADRERAGKALADNTADVTRLTRSELCARLLHGGEDGLLDTLGRQNQALPFGFGEALTPISTSTGGEDAPDLASPYAPVDPVTDIGQALRQAVESQADRPISGVVVLSDGQFNRGEPVSVVAQYMRARQLPVWTVGVGDPSEPRNVSIRSVDAPPNVFVGDPFQITANLSATGLTGATCTVELFAQHDGSDARTLIASKPVTIDTTGQIDPVVFTHDLKEAGKVRLIVQCRPQDGETLLEDNQRHVSVNGLDDRMRVLVVAGAPSWSYRYLTRLLQRDATFDVSCWLQSADESAVRDGNTVIDHFPRTNRELAEYDCIVLMDPHPGDFDPEWATHVETLVSNFGCGLLYVAGRAHTPRLAHSVNARALIEMLPVIVEPGESDLMLNKLAHYQPAGWPVEVPPESSRHPVLAMSSHPEENTQIWSRLPGAYWHYPVKRAKPVATVLLRHSSPQMRNQYGGHVLLATQFFGSGRTGYLGYNETWRWRRLGDEYFNRFWVQLLRHMVEGKLLSGQKRGMIQLERDQCTVRQPVRIEARLLDDQHRPLDVPAMEVTAETQDGIERALRLVAEPGRPGWYRGQYVPTETGTHALHISLPAGETGDPITIRADLRVEQPDLEYLETRLNRQSLRMLSEGSAGGAYRDIDEADHLASLIPSRSTSIVLTGEPTPLWNRWWTLTLLVVLLGSEWALRKRARML